MSVVEKPQVKMMDGAVLAQQLHDECCGCGQVLEGDGLAYWQDIMCHALNVLARNGMQIELIAAHEGPGHGH